MLDTSWSKTSSVLSRFGCAVTSNLPSQSRENRALFNSCVLIQQMALLGAKPNRYGLVCGVVYTSNVLGRCGADAYAR